MNIEFIESKLGDIIKELEKEVMEILSDHSLDKRETNLQIKPITSTRQILDNAMDSIKMVDRLAKEQK